MHGVKTNLFQEGGTATNSYHLDFPLYPAAPNDGLISDLGAPSTSSNNAIGGGKLGWNSVVTIPTQRTQKELSVLIVDDSAMVRRVTSKLLAGLGHSVVEACDGDKAVDLVASGVHFDVILMDNEMPVMTGVEATQIIRKTLGYKGLILGVTGNALEEDIAEFTAAGVTKVVLKPITKEIFVKETTQCY
jgi:CheY-like chemotaxis protein